MRPGPRLAIAAGAVALAVVALVALGRLGPSPADDAALAFGRGVVVVETARGPVRFDVEVARTADQHARGLMFRTALAPDAGMLFVYPREREVTMWMKNTLIPLDMLFATDDGRITRIVRDTTPMSTATIASGRPVRYALEVPAGTAERLGIARGDRLRYEPAD